MKPLCVDAMQTPMDNLMKAFIYLKLDNADQVLCSLPTLVALACLAMLTLLGK